MHRDTPPLKQTPVADVELSALFDAARSALGQLAARRPELDQRREAERCLERTVSLLAHNIAAGRFRPACPFSRATALLDYAARVVAGQLADGERVEAFRAGDTSTWTVIIERLERQAYHRLGPQGRHEWAADEARELAAATCADLWEWLQTHLYPFDVPFDRWLTCALNHRLYYRGRKRAADQGWIIASLDEPVYPEGATFGELVQADDIAAWLERETHREAFAAALACLDARQAQVIRLWYFEGWPVEEIAAALGVRISYLYVLRGRAVAGLRKIMTGAKKGRRRRVS